MTFISDDTEIKYCGKDMEEAYQMGKKDGVNAVIKSYTLELPTLFCAYCNQEGCDGGMVGSIQECESVRMLKDLLNDFAKELYEGRKSNG